MAFIDVFDLSGYLGIDTTELGWLGEFSVRAASEAVEGILDSPIGLVEDAEITLDGTGTDALVLPGLHVVEVSAVSVAGVELDPEADFALGSAGILYRTFPCVWTRGRRNIVVTLTSGYAEIGDVDGDQVPMDIREAALDYAKGVFQAGSAPPPGISGETSPLYSYTVSSASAAAAAATSRMADLRVRLHRYISVRVA